MTNDLARWQVATTSIYHFLLVPVTIGLALLVAILQTAYYRNVVVRPKRASGCEPRPRTSGQAPARTSVPIRT